MATPIPLELSGFSSRAIQAIGGAQTIYAYSATNPNVYPVYLKFYDKLAVTVNPATDTPAYKITVPSANLAGQGLAVNDNVSIAFTTAISVRCTPVDQDQDVMSPATSPFLSLQLDQAGGGGTGDALKTQPLSQFAATTSAQLRGVITDELGTGQALFDGATPTSLVLTNATGLPESGVTNLVSDLAAKAPLASPTFTGTVTLPSGQALIAPVLGTPASGNASNLTALNATQLTSGTVPVARLTSQYTDIDIATATSGSTSTLVAGTEYFGAINSATWTIAFSGSPGSGGPPIIMRVNFQQPTVLTVPTSYRTGNINNPVTSISLDAGYHTLGWIRSNSIDWLLDDQDDFSGLLQSINNLSDLADSSVSLTNLVASASAASQLSVLDNLEEKGANISSATTTDLSTVTGKYVEITGTTTITSFGTVVAGTRRLLRFQGILTLTYNATSLILPGSVSITTAVGDVAQFESLGGGNWRCISYFRSNGQPVVGGSGTVNSGTSGQLAYYAANGTAVSTLSVPTFPTVSATSGKIIKSDGTNWVASTETYAAPGASGNVLQSDGTNWTSVATGSRVFAAASPPTVDVGLFTIKTAADAINMSLGQSNVFTTVFTVPSSRTFVCTGAQAFFTTVSGAAVGTTTWTITESGANAIMFNVGTSASGSFTPILNRFIFLSSSGTVLASTCAAGNNVQVKVTTGHTGTTSLLSQVYLTGYYSA